MAVSSPLTLRNKVIYEVYVRNHGKSGKFEDIHQDLGRIKNLGTDIIWFMPLHPIGEKNKKGSLGCPYSISDYRGINPEYGTIDEFRNLIDAIHYNDMLVMIDVVFNHTSRDSYLLKNHPEYFYRRPDGEIGNKVGDWSDVCDLDYNNKNLWKELIDTLKYWVKLGVDGFRCDVASLVPVAFWSEARKEISKINPDFIWLSETVHPGFITYLREEGFLAQSDSEIYNAFDITYDYDVYDYFKGYINGTNSLNDYLERLRIQEYIYPANYSKLRFIENHDSERGREFIKDKRLFDMWTAFLFFQKGTALVYAGQETEDTKTPSLFDVEKVDWSTLDDEYCSTLARLSRIKKNDLVTTGNYKIHDRTDHIFLTYRNSEKILAGIFNVEQKSGTIKVDLKDGTYKNLFNDTDVKIINGEVELMDYPLIFEVKLV